MVEASLMGWGEILDNFLVLGNSITETSSQHPETESYSSFPTALVSIAERSNRTMPQMVPYINNQVGRLLRRK